MKDKVYSPKTVFFKILLWGGVFSLFFVIIARALSYTSDITLEHWIPWLDLANTLCTTANFLIGSALLWVSFSHFSVKKSLSLIILSLLLILFKYIFYLGIVLIIERPYFEEYMVSAILLASFDLIKFLIVCTSFLFLAKRVRTHTIPLLITCLTMTVINIIFRVLFVSFGVFNGEILALYLSDIILFGAGFLFMQWIVKKESKKIQ